MLIALSSLSNARLMRLLRTRSMTDWTMICFVLVDVLYMKFFRVCSPMSEYTSFPGKKLIRKFNFHDFVYWVWMSSGNKDCTEKLIWLVIQWFGLFSPLFPLTYLCGSISYVEMLILQSYGSRNSQFAAILLMWTETCLVFLTYLLNTKQSGRRHWLLVCHLSS